MMPFTLSLMAAGLLLSAGEPAAPQRTAVVELFTSQGCSSCPPADALLRNLEGQSHVITLSFHVDYWNYLGWKDPFSHARYSQRQRDYAAMLAGGRTYTPMMVVQGSQAFVGSDSRAAKAAIAAALAQHGRPWAQVMGAQRTGASLLVRVRHGAVPNGGVLEVVAAHPRAVVQVKRGENSGKTLEHHHVVRNLARVNAHGDGDAEVTLVLPPDVQAGNLYVAVLVKHAGSPTVLAAHGANMALAGR